jgi:hypothetical protein
MLLYIFQIHTFPIDHQNRLSNLKNQENNFLLLNKKIYGIGIGQ